MLHNLSLSLNFEWSFRPVILFLACLGVDLSSRTNRWFINCYALIWLIFNIASNIYFRFNASLNAFTAFTTVYRSTFQAFAVIAYVGNHLILVFFIRPKFVAVMQLFNRLENQLNDQKVFIKTRKFSISCVALTLLVVNYFIIIR